MRASYIRFSPMRGREAGAAGSAAGPFSFMHWTMRLCVQAVQLEGIVMISCDGELLGDIAYDHGAAGGSSTLPGAGLARRCRQFRGACDPVGASRNAPGRRNDGWTGRAARQGPEIFQDLLRGSCLRL